MRLIDADALLDDVRKHSVSYFADDFAKEWVDKQPTLDAVPVRRGRWIRIYSRPGVFKYLGWTCDQCGQRTGNEYAPQWYKFCPNCGADMRGERHDVI